MSAVEQHRQRTFDWVDPLGVAARAAELPGLELMRAIIAGELPPPPIAKLLEFEIVEAGPGRAVFALRPAEWMYNPIGSVHGGVAATILDSCMGCAVHTTLEAGVGYTTTDLQVRYLRAMHAGGGRVLAEGQVVHSGRRTATAEGRLFLEEDESVLFAHASTGCVILRQGARKRLQTGSGEDLSGSPEPAPSSPRSPDRRAGRHAPPQPARAGRSPRSGPG